MIGREERVAELGERADRPRQRRCCEARGSRPRSAIATSTSRCIAARSSASTASSAPAAASSPRPSSATARSPPASSSSAGKPARIRDMHEALQRHRIGYVSEDRKQEGLILMHSVKDNIAITIWQRLAGALGLIAPARRGPRGRALRPPARGAHAVARRSRSATSRAATSRRCRSPSGWRPMPRS